jgi:membrane-bound serine protease (ClpP class)
LLLLLLIAPWARAEPNRGPFSKIAVIVLKDTGEQMIDPSVKTSVLRRIAEAREFGADCVIFDIESYGGRVDASLETGQEMLELGTDIHTIAYIHRKAFSGAALLALACREVVMSDIASIGDSQVVTMGPDGRAVAPEKAQTVVAAEFRKYAQRNGYPEALCEAMVRQELEIWRYRKLNEDGTETSVFFRGDRLPDRTEQEVQGLTDPEVIVPEAELATFTAPESVEHGIASRLLPSVDALIKEIEAPDARVVRLQWNEAEELSRWLLNIRPILFLFGIVAAYIAFKTPGTGVPELLSLLLFGLYFGASAIAGFAEIWEILLFFAGVALILVEIFVLPGFGVPGFLGLALILLSLALTAIPDTGGVDDFGPVRPYLIDIGKDFVVAALFATVAIFFIAKHLPRIPFFGRLALQAPDADSAMSAVGEPKKQHPLVGSVGVAVSTLRPSGRARINDDEFDVISEGAYIEPGHRIRVISVKGNVIVVRPEQESA